MPRGMAKRRSASDDEGAVVRPGPPQKSHSIHASFTTATTAAASSLKSHGSSHSGQSSRRKIPGRSLSFSSSNHSGGSRGRRNRRLPAPLRTLSFSSNDDDSLQLDSYNSGIQLQQFLSSDDQTTSSASTPPPEHIARESRASIKRPSYRKPSQDSNVLKLQDELTVNKLRFGLLDIYGRDKERGILTDIVSRAMSCTSQTPQRHLVLISGISGVGKTSLACTVKRNVRRAGGSFVIGKYDINQSSPYSALLSGCSELCCQLLAMNKNKSNTSAESVGLSADDYYELLKIIPDLGAVVDEPVALSTDSSQDGIPAVENGRTRGTISIAHGQGAVILHESKNRFHYLFRKFFFVTAALLEGPQVIVLDDTQWADLASLELLEALLNDSKGTSRDEIPNLIIFGLYRYVLFERRHLHCPRNILTEFRLSFGSLNGRSSDVGPSHMVNKLIQNTKQRVGKSNSQVTEIELDNLDEANIQAMLSDLLSTTNAEQLRSFASICHQKTKGNPFFLVQYLTMLYEKELLQYNFGTCSWMWDEEKIQTETRATNNVVDVMTGKMQDLCPDLSRLLEVAACLGSTFQHNTLEYAWEMLASKPKLPLDDIVSMAIADGFLESSGKGSSITYQWVHDSILEAAAVLCPDEEHKTLQFEIGMILAKRMKQEQIGSIFVAMNLLNDGMPSALDEAKKLELTEMNLQAAQNAVTVSAFESASQYVRKGIDLMPSDYWTMYPKLALELHSLGAEVNACLGNIDELESHCNLVIGQDIPLLDKMRVYYVVLDSKADRQDIPTALNLCLEVLAKLGCTFPRNPVSVNLVTITNVLKFQSQAYSRDLNEVLSMPPMTDQRRIEVMRLLDRLATYCYLSENLLLPVTIVRRLKYTLRYGVTDSSAVDFIGLALILTSKLLDFQAGSAYANFAMLLLERLDSKRSHSRAYMVAYAFVFPWTQPTATILKYLLMAYEYGM